MEINISEAEWEVMRVVWSNNQVTSKLVIEILKEKKSWSVSTIKTLLSRLVEKDMLQTEKIGNKFLYSAKCSENDCLEVLTTNFIRKFCSKKTKNIIKYAIEENNLSKSDIDEVIEILQNKRKSAKDVTSLIVNGQKVNVLLPKNVKVNCKNSADGFILVSNKKNIEYTRIYPKNLILGIGCKKDTKAEDILSAIENCLDKNNLDIKSVKKIATVDVKENEQGLINAAKFLNLDLEIISREEIRKIQNQFEGSDFVEKNIGVRAVSEPVALLSSTGNGKFLVMKEKYNGITISIYEEEIEIYE